MQPHAEIRFDPEFLMILRADFFKARSHAVDGSHSLVGLFDRPAANQAVPGEVQDVAAIFVNDGTGVVDEFGDEAHTFARGKLFGDCAGAHHINKKNHRFLFHGSMIGADYEVKEMRRPDHMDDFKQSDGECRNDDSHHQKHKVIVRGDVRKFVPAVEHGRGEGEADRDRQRHIDKVKNKLFHRMHAPELESDLTACDLEIDQPAEGVKHPEGHRDFHVAQSGGIVRRVPEQSRAAEQGGDYQQMFRVKHQQGDSGDNDRFRPINIDNVLLID